MEKYSYYEINKFQTKINNNNNNSITHIISTNKNIKNKSEEEDIRKITEKLKEEKKTNKILKTENEKLYQDIITIKTNIKSLIPSISQNKKNPFPSLEILIEEIKTYLNTDSIKFYQKLQNRKFPSEIIIIHFKYILQKSQELLNNHFSSVDFILNKRFKSQELIKPIQNVLKNAYQVDWKNIFNKLTTDEKLNKILQEIKQNIIIKLNKKINNINNITNYCSPTYMNNLKEYIKSTINILLKCYLNSPKICFDISKIGRIEKFNSSSNECFINEKIIRRSDVIIIFPSFYYNNDKYKKIEIINKDKIVFNKQNDKNNNVNYNNYTTNNSGYSYKNNKNGFKNNYFSKKFEEEQDNNNFYNRNKINQIYTGYRNNNYSWSNNNKNINSRLNTNQNIKKIYFQPKGDKGDDEFIDSENEGFKYYRK